jgi:polygalacturonase
MIKRSKCHFLICLIGLLIVDRHVHAQPLDKLISGLTWFKEVGAKTIPKIIKTYKVADFGAVGDGTTINTKAIQSTIDACSNNGGGEVIFEKGAYLTGSLFIKKNVHFKIDKGVELLGSQNISDYPEIDTRVAGIEMKWPAALINILDQDNVAFTGEGVINAQGKVFWEKYWNMRKDYDVKGLRWIVDYDCKRVRTVLISGSSNVTIKGLTLRYSGFWTVQVLYSKYVTVAGLTIQNNVEGTERKGPSTDGVDIDSSTYVLVEDCDIDCNDDDFCLKAGRDADGLRVNRPTEYIIIRNCLARRGGGLLTCGSETSGSIRNVLAYNLKANGTNNCINFKSASTRGGTVENVYIYNVEMNNVGTSLQVTMNWNPAYSYSTLPASYNYDSIPPHWKVMLTKVSPEQGLPHFRNIYLSNLKGTAKKAAITAAGMKESLAENFNLSDIDIQSNTAGEITFAKGWKFDKVIINAKDKSTLSVINSEDMKLAK